MPLSEITLRDGTQASTGIARFACAAPAVYPDGRVAVTMDVSAVGAGTMDMSTIGPGAGPSDAGPVDASGGAGHEYLLHPGDTFPVHDQTWQLDRVEDPGTDHWRVRLIRIG